MATKPTDVPRWGTDETNDTPPTSGEMDTGYTNSQIPSSAKLNWLLRTIYEWILYLKDGIFSTAVTFQAERYHGNRTMNISSTAGQTQSVGGWQYPSLGTTARSWAPPITPAGGEIVEFAIPLAEGDRIQAVYCDIKDTSGGTITAKLYTAVGSTNTQTQRGATHTSSGAGAIQVLDPISAGGGIPYVLAAAEYAFVQIANVNATTTTHAIFSVRVVYDRVP